MSNSTFTVGEWLVIPSANTIKNDETSVQIPPRLVDLLVFFAKNAGEVISRDIIVQSVWDRDFVTDQAVTQSIFELRKHLRNGRSPKDAPIYIRTIPKRGYRLVAPVSFEPEVEHQEPARNTTDIDNNYTEPPLTFNEDSNEFCSAETDSEYSDSPRDESEKRFGSRVLKLAKNLWLDESSLGFKKSMY